MSNKQAQTVFIAGTAFAVAYWALSQRGCQKACRAFFQPLASEAGKLLASTLMAALITSQVSRSGAQIVGLLSNR